MIGGDIKSTTQRERYQTHVQILEAQICFSAEIYYTHAYFRKMFSVKNITLRGKREKDSLVLKHIGQGSNFVYRREEVELPLSLVRLGYDELHLHHPYGAHCWGYSLCLYYSQKGCISYGDIQARRIRANKRRNFPYLWVISDLPSSGRTSTGIL